MMAVEGQDGQQYVVLEVIQLPENSTAGGDTQSYIHQVLQTIQMKLILLCFWAEPAVLGSAKTALKFKYKI